MRKLNVLITVKALVLMCFFSTCKSHEVMLPSYLYLKPATLITKPGQGYPSMAVYDYWIFTNGEVRGDFSTGSTIPLQRTGSTTVIASAGIKYSGNAEQRTIYQMFNPYSKDIAFTAGHVDTIAPVFSYADNAVFPLIEDYDGNGSAFQFNSNRQVGDTVIKDNGPEAWLPGNYSGRVKLGGADPNGVLELQSKEFTDIPLGHPFYLEMDFKSNMVFSFGFYARDLSNGDVSQYSIYILKESADWKRLYYDLASEVYLRKANTGYKLFFRFSNANAVVDPYVLLDNIKLIYLP